jgi:hypothetical protein
VKPYFTYRDRRHWSLDIGRFFVYRWCPGAPCHRDGVEYERHSVRMGVDR